MFRVEDRGDSARFAVRAQPRASRTELAGAHGEAVRVRLAAPPVEGAANAELISFLAKKLSVSKSAVRIVQGERGRDKVVEVDGLSAEQVRGRLA
ncbi:MAG: DUF167 domain-containing protein [Gemmatimonadales bacterium]|jgi:uncharacterized protein (TIGR00251 family)